MSLQKKIIDGKERMVYDPTGGSSGDFNKMSLNEINKLIDSVTNLVEATKKQDMIKLKKENYNEYENKLSALEPNFSETNYTLFKKIIDGEDISVFFQMIEYLLKINSGKISVEDAENNLGKTLSKKFIKS